MALEVRSARSMEDYARFVMALRRAHLDLAPLNAIRWSLGRSLEELPFFLGGTLG